MHSFIHKGSDSSPESSRTNCRSHTPLKGYQRMSRTFYSQQCPQTILRYTLKQAKIVTLASKTAAGRASVRKLTFVTVASEIEQHHRHFLTVQVTALLESLESGTSARQDLLISLEQPLGCLGLQLHYLSFQFRYRRLRLVYICFICLLCVFICFIQMCIGSIQICICFIYVFICYIYSCIWLL